jgi:ABC-type phosphate transport system substrate-binding protein
MKQFLIILIIAFNIFSGELIIANVNGVKSLSKLEIKKIYLGKKMWWSDGTKIRLTTSNRELSDLFMKKYLGRKYSQFEIYWKQLSFTGRGMMPKSLPSQDKVIQFIKENPGAIGYVSDSTKVVDGISIISVIEN